MHDKQLKHKILSLSSSKEFSGIMGITFCDFKLINLMLFFLKQANFKSVLETLWRRKSMQFRLICLFTLHSTQEIYIPSDSQEISLQTCTNILVQKLRWLKLK